MEKNLYYLLTEQNLFTHGIGKINDYDILWKFENILEMQGLFSKQVLRNIRPQIKGKVGGNIRITSESFVSVFDPSLPNIKKRLLRGGSGLPFNVNDVTFLIDSAIEFELFSKRCEFDYSEIMVKESIPIKYFSGIIIPDNKEFYNSICSIMKKHEVMFPVYDVNGNCLNDSLKKHTL